MRSGGSPQDWKVIPLDQQGVTVYASPDPATVHLGQPTLAVLPAGRIVAALDQYGPGVRNLPGAKGKIARLNRWVQGKILVSGDKGQTWSFRHDAPFCDPCLFRDGATLYLIGHADAIQIIKSSDGGETWSKPADLSAAADHYVQAPANVLCANGAFYLVMLRLTDTRHRGDPASLLAPVVLKAPVGANLTAARNWTFSAAAKAFRELVPADALDYFGLPFFAVPDPLRGRDVGNKRWAHRIGWSDAHLLQLCDPNHYWHDPAGRTLHLLARAAAHRSNMAALAKVVEGADGELSVGLETTPAGTKAAFLPLPGGNLKFHALYDEPSRLYWLVGNQTTDSMTRAEKLPATRYRLPCDECRRLQLHSSRNLVDWCFAGYITAGADAGDCRHSPGAAVRGNDLCVVACAGEGRRRNPHDADRITFHLIPDFRELAG